MAVTQLLLTAMLLTIRFLLPGAAWLWLFPTRSDNASNRLVAGCRGCATAVLISVILSGATALVLGLLGAYKPIFEVAVLAAFVIGGLAVGSLVRKQDIRGSLLSIAPAGLVLFIVFCGALLAPERGEWMLGGWDPGVYINESVALADTDTLSPDDSFFYDDLTVEERVPFLRNMFVRTERFPGVLVDASKKAFTFEFFRWTPALFSSVYRTGGIVALNRVNLVLGILVLVVLFAFVEGAAGFSAALFAALMLLGQPVWLYHTHVPVSEMAHLILVGGLCLGVVHRKEGACWHALMLASLITAILNRFSFLPFAGFLLIFLAWDDGQRSERRQVLVERLLQLAAVGVGLFSSQTAAPSSIEGWTVAPTLFAAFTSCAVVAIVIDVVAFNRKVTSWAARIPNWFWYAGVGVAGAILIAASRTPHGVGQQADEDNVYKLLGYVGVLPVLLSFIGGVFLIYTRKIPRTFKIVVSYLVAITAILLYRKNIMDWYPWATRRYLAYTIPAVVILSGLALGFLWTLPGKAKVIGRTIAALLLVGSLALNKRRIELAWRYTDYDGVSAPIQTLADQVKENDILVCDHPWWGTPLALYHGKQVLNGRHMWRDKSGETAAKGLPVLRRLAADGKSIKFVTSTDSGTDIYPFENAEFELLWSGEKFEMKEVVHHPKEIAYTLRDKEAVLRIYRMLP